MAYKRIIYCSRYVEENKLGNIFKFLKKAREYNESVGISGYLIFGNGLFLQIMEGFTGPLEDLMSRIEKDKRHDNIVFLDSKKIETLSFDNWNMGFTDISGKENFELKKKGRWMLQSKILKAFLIKLDNIQLVYGLTESSRTPQTPWPPTSRDILI